jgi:hypothetical protein
LVKAAEGDGRAPLKTFDLSAPGLGSDAATVPEEVMTRTEKKHVLQQMLGAQLEDWERILASEKTKVEFAKGAGPAGRGADESDPLADRLETFRKKLAELERASEEKWEELKSDVEDAWAEIKIRLPLHS